MKEIYTHDEAARILDLFEDTLDKYNIRVPSEEDDEREPDNEAKLYGSTYSALLDDVEWVLKELLYNHKPDTKVITGMFSGR